MLPHPPGLQPRFMFGTFTSVLAAATARQSVSSPTVRVGGHPPGSCMPAGGGWRANDAVADTSRVPTKDSVKTETPPDAASAPLTILEASIGLRAPISPPTTKPADGGRAAAPQHLLFLQSDRAVDARLTAALGQFACPAELRSARISDSNAVESDRFSVSSRCADWQRACASFARANSSLLEDGQGELERADQALGDPHCTPPRRCIGCHTVTPLAMPTRSRCPVCLPCLPCINTRSVGRSRCAPAAPPRRNGDFCSSPRSHQAAGPPLARPRRRCPSRPGGPRLRRCPCLCRFRQRPRWRRISAARRRWRS